MLKILQNHVFVVGLKTFKINPSFIGSRARIKHMNDVLQQSQANFDLIKPILTNFLYKNQTLLEICLN